MLTPHLKKFLDEKWDNCWPVSNLRPVAILDLISYIFFIKRLDDAELITKSLPSLQSDHFISTKEIEEFTWTKLKDLPPQGIHELFTNQYGLIELMNSYAQSNFLYSNFFKTPLLIKPTPKLLLNVIEINNLIEASDPKTQAAIVEYLLSKAEKAQKELLFIPEYLSRLMVSFAEPKSSDFICDISTGYGTLLITAVEYLKNNQPESSLFQSNLFFKLKGIQSNISQLRFTAMRMMLHGINDPDLKIIAGEEVSFTQKPTLFISDLLFAGIEENALAPENTIAPDKLLKESDLLMQIMKNLQSPARAIVLVSENLLKSELPEIQKVRKEIVDNTDLEAVIQLFPNSKSYSAAGILVFNKQSDTTNQVWFCKMDKAKKRRTVNEIFSNPEQNDPVFLEELNQVNSMLDNWKNRKETSNVNDNSFYINAYDIKTNGYNLNYNDYKVISAAQQLDKTDENENTPADLNDTIVATKKGNLDHFFQPAAPLRERKRRRKILPVVLVILILIIAGGWLYLFYFKSPKNLYSHIAASSDSVPATSKIAVKNASLHQTDENVRIKKSAANKSLVNASAAENTIKSIPPSDSSHGYTVINKTWFHYAPDSTKRKSLYLEPRENLILKPTAEENGFVYVVYINKKGESTRGWLDKKDLEPVE